MASQEKDLQDYRNAVLAVNAAMRFIAQHDLPKMRKVLDEVDAIGPVMQPINYRVMRDKIEFDKAILDAAMPLWKFNREKASKQNPIVQSTMPSIIVPGKGS